MQAVFLIVRSQFIKCLATAGFHFPAIGKDILGADTTVQADPTAGNPPLVEELNQVRAGNLQQFSGTAGCQFVVQGAHCDASFMSIWSSTPLSNRTASAGMSKVKVPKRAHTGNGPSIDGCIPTWFP